MITKIEFETLQLEIKGKLEQTRTLIKEKDNFILKNLYNEELEIDVFFAASEISDLKDYEKELLDILYTLYERYNSQFSKPVPAHPLKL